MQPGDGRKIGGTSPDTVTSVQIASNTANVVTEVIR